MSQPAFPGYVYGWLMLPFLINAFQVFRMMPCLGIGNTPKAKEKNNSAHSKQDSVGVMWWLATGAGELLELM